MLRENDRIAVAVSGGKDSAVLLDVLTRIEKEFSNAEIVPFTVDEGIRGYRDKALKTAIRLSRSLGLAIEVCTFKELFGFTLDEIVQSKKKGGLGVCSYCGVLRRRAMNDMAARLDADVVATGHNLDDEAQTVIMNIMRGDGRRIGRMNRYRDYVIPGFVPRVKPISELSERDIVAYAHYLDLPYHDVPCPYAGEAFRNEIRLFLNRMEHDRPGTLLAIVHSVEDLSQALQQGLKTDESQVCERCGGPSTATLCKVCEMLDDIGGGHCSRG
jgi:uncharacterized protein (TIGR00269 family)